MQTCDSNGLQFPLKDLENYLKLLSIGKKKRTYITDLMIIR
jgi:hypothetical protein